MEAVAILIISIAGLTLLIIAVVSVASNLDKQNIPVKKTNNNSFQKPYKSKQLESESTKAYKEILKKSSKVLYLHLSHFPINNFSSIPSSSS